MPYSTVERVDCTVAEQYNVSITARRIHAFNGMQQPRWGCK